MLVEENRDVVRRGFVKAIDLFEMGVKEADVLIGLDEMRGYSPLC